MTAADSEELAPNHFFRIVLKFTNSQLGLEGAIGSPAKSALFQLTPVACFIDTLLPNFLFETNVQPD